MFTHFGDVCRSSDADNLGWWCDLCQIPKYWKDGTDLIRHKQVMHNIFEFPSALSYGLIPSGCSGKKLEYSLKKFDRPKQRQLWWDDVEKYAQFTTTQIGYRAWYDQLVQTEDILVHPKRAAGVAVPQEGLEIGPAGIIWVFVWNSVLPSLTAIIFSIVVVLSSKFAISSPIDGETILKNCVCSVLDYEPRANAA